MTQLQPIGNRRPRSYSSGRTSLTEAENTLPGHGPLELGHECQIRARRRVFRQLL